MGSWKCQWFAKTLKELFRVSSAPSPSSVPASARPPSSCPCVGTTCPALLFPAWLTWPRFLQAQPVQAQALSAASSLPSPAACAPPGCPVPVGAAQALGLQRRLVQSTRPRALKSDSDLGVRPHQVHSPRLPRSSSHQAGGPPPDPWGPSLTRPGAALGHQYTGSFTLRIILEDTPPGVSEVPGGTEPQLQQAGTQWTTPLLWASSLPSPTP